ncbi:MAG: hypothetical protein ACHQ4J_03820 [Candidatus Binatia bacterium]
MAKIIINVGHQLDGYTFRLHPKSKAEVEASFPKRERASSVFVSYETHHAFAEMHGPIENHIVPVLTGLTAGEVQSVGGFAVVDPVNGKELLCSSAHQNV